MAFLTKAELKTVATIPIIDKLTATDDSIVVEIIEESISLMKGYLSKYYDVTAIFTAEGDERHKTVLKKLKDICIYEIYERHTREQNLVAKRRFEEVMLWLEKLNTGEFYDKTLRAYSAESESSTTGRQSDDIRCGVFTR